MAFLILLFITIVIGVLLANWSVIKKTYLGPHGLSNLLALILALVSAGLGAVLVFSLRQLYVPDTKEAPHWWRSLQGLDAFIVTFLLVLCGGLYFYLKTWYRRRSLRRFTFVTSAQSCLFGVSGLLRTVMAGSGIQDSWVWAVLLLTGLIVLAMRIFGDRVSLSQDFQDLSTDD